MKPLSFALLFSFALAATATAQDSTSTHLWSKALVGQASGAQAGFSNWAEGGVNTLAVTLGADGSAERSGDKWGQKHDMRLTFGMVRQGDQDLRKAEDLIRLRSSYQYVAGEGFLATLQPTFAASFRSQFADGKNFDEDPTGQDRDLPVKVSEFLSPGTLTQTLGLTYNPRPWFTQRVGVAAKETVVRREELRSLYGVDPDKSVRAELGIEAVTDFDKELATNVHYKSTLGLFASFNKPESPDLIWENVVAMKVNSWLGVNFEWTLLYDKDVTDQLQAKEVFSIGISYIFI